jgi:hypothetical protein
MSKKKDRPMDFLADGKRASCWILVCICRISARSKLKKKKMEDETSDFCNENMHTTFFIIYQKSVRDMLGTILVR